MAPAYPHATGVAVYPALFYEIFGQQIPKFLRETICIEITAFINSLHNDWTEFQETLNAAAIRYIYQ